MRQMNTRVVVTGAVLIGLALLFFLGMLAIAPKSTDPVELMRVVGQVVGVVGALGVVMIIFGLIRRK